MEEKKDTDTLRLAMIGNSTAKIIHDMNSPLITLSLLINRIIKLSVTCQSDLHTSCPIHDRLEKANIHIKKMSRGINEILDIARGSQVKPNYSNVKYDQYLGNLLNNINEDLETRSLSCKISFHPGYSGEVYLDQERFGRIIENLIKNAAEALVKQKEKIIEVASYEEDGYIVTTISDNGPGIPDEITANIFLEQNTTGKEMGTGFGLLICKEMIDLHDGQIDYTTSGKGTMFSLKIPKSVKKEG